MVVVIILQTSAEGRRYGQPLANVHGMIFFMGVAPVAKGERVRPVVLDHIDPQCENPDANPHHERECQTVCEHPQEREAEELRNECEQWTSNDPKCLRLQDFVVSYIFLTFVRKQTEI